MSSANAKKEKSKKGERVITKEKHVPAKVVVGNVPDIDFRPPQEHMKGALAVIVSDGKVTRSWTIHHPIGITDLHGSDWVLSESKEVPTLLAHRTDDDAPRKQQMRATYRERMAMNSKPPILAADMENVTIYPGTGNRRHEVLKEARERVNRHYQIAHEKWKRAGSRKEEEPVKESILDCIKSASDRMTERKFVEFCNQDETKAEVNRVYPDNFRTRFGPKLDQEQESIVHEGYTVTSGQAFDAICYRIESMVLAPREILEAMDRGEDPDEAGKLVKSVSVRESDEKQEAPPESDSESSGVEGSDPGEGAEEEI